MKCPNCGAEYEDYLEVCPYCDMENRELLQKKQEAYLRGVKSRRVNLKTAANEKTGRVNRRITKVFAVLAVLVLAGVIAAWFSAHAKLRREQEKREEAARELEALYEAEDWEGLRDYYFSDQHDVYSAAFDKYFEVAHCWYYAEDAKGQIERSISTALYYDPEKADEENEWIVSDIAFRLNEAMHAIREIDVLEEQGYIYGEEEAVSGFRAGLCGHLRTYYDLSDDEIEEMVARYVDYETDYSEEAITVIQRVREREAADEM